MPSSDAQLPGTCIATLASCGSDDSSEPTAITPSSSSESGNDGSAEDADTTDSADTEATQSDSEEAQADTDSDSDYAPFSDVDPAGSPFFSALEDTDLVERTGEQEIYERRLTICRDFDSGTTLDSEIDRLLAAGFGEDTPLLMAAAVTGICPQHVDSTTG